MKSKQTRRKKDVTRSEIIIARVTVAEKKQIRKRLGIRGRNASEKIRLMLLNGEIT